MKRKVDTIPFCVFIFMMACTISLPISSGAQEEGASGSQEELSQEKKELYAERREAVQLARDGFLDEAVNLMTLLYRRAEDDPNITADYITILSWAGRSQEAVIIYEKHRGEMATKDYVLPEIAKAYRLILSYEKAISIYSLYIDRYPLDIEANKGLALTYIEAERFDEAERIIDAFLLENKDSKLWLSLKSLADARQGVWESFFKAARRASEAGPGEGYGKYAAAWLEEGFSRAYDEAMMLAREGKYEAAFWMMDNLKASGYESEKMAVDKIVINVWMERYDEAVRGYEALARDLKMPLYLLKAAALAYEKTGENEKAASIYEEIFKIAPEDSEIKLGMLKTEGMYEETEKVIDKLLAKEPDNIKYILRKAEILCLKGETEGFLARIKDARLSDHPRETRSLLDSIIPALSEKQWLELYLSFVEKERSRRFVYAEVALLLEWLKKQARKSDDYQLFKYELFETYSLYPDDIKLDLAEVATRYGDYDNATALYLDLLEKDPLNIEALSGLAGIHMERGEYEAALKIADDILEENPRSAQALFLKGHILEKKKEYIKATEVYQKIREYNLAQARAENLEIRALMDMGANSVAKERLAAMGDKADEILTERVRGNEAMQRIHWEEPKEAIKLIEADISYYEKKAEKDGTVYGQPEFVKREKPDGSVEYVLAEEDMEKQAYFRAKWDMILAMRKDTRMEDIIAEYKRYLAEGITLPFWIREAAGDAYLYLEQPKKALELYEGVLAEQPENYNTKMAIYHALVELRRFEEARDVIDELDKETPARIYERGIMRDNWRKAEIAYAKAWWFLYHDRYKDAMEYLDTVGLKAPFNSNLRNARAHAHFWRGWPRKALEEFEIIRTLDLPDPSVENGYCLALNANMERKEAREHLVTLLEKFPKFKHLKRTKRYFEVEDMTTLTTDIYYSYDMPGNDEFYLARRLDKYLGYHTSVFGELIRRETIGGEGENVLDKMYAGLIWQPDNVWKLTGAVSSDFDGLHDFGCLTEVSLTPDDYWTFDAGYEHKVTDIPIRSRAQGVEADEYTLAATYRMDERADTSFAYTLRDYSDENKNQSYLWRTNSYHIIKPDWRYGFGTEYYFSTNSKQDVDYYSPKHIHSFYVIPMIEHTWFRRYERAVVDRLYLGLGRFWQDGYEGEPVGYLTYEQDVKISETFLWLLGATQSLRNYDGDHVHNFTVYSTIKNKF